MFIRYAVEKVEDYMQCNVGLYKARATAYKICSRGLYAVRATACHIAVVWPMHTTALLSKQRLV